ncbi:MAG: tripartite tricarboxylate transporter TctB family protein [Armatimonadota bacterium]|nr:tripartite tricarboxylate transporter TctB family protein [Armatimonadota bacterium]
MGRDGIIGLLLFVLSAWLYRHAAGIPRPPFVPLGPDFYPRLILGVMGVLGLALASADLLVRKNRGAAERRERGDFRQTLSRYRGVIITYLLFGGYVALIPLVGFRTTTALFVAALSWYLGPKTPRHVIYSLSLGIGTAVVIHIVFEVYLRLLLPRGILI